MFDCWSEIKILVGRTLYTLAQRQPFDVLDISPHSVLIMPHRNRNEIVIPRHEIEDSYKDLIANRKITAIQIKKRHADFHSAFVSTFLAELPDIHYTLNPITLYTASEEKPKQVLKTAYTVPPSKPPEPPQAPPDAHPAEPSRGRFRDRASFGKRMEFLIKAELLRRGCDVYDPLIDDQGIDCIIRIEKDGAVRYLEIQVKTRSKDIDPTNAALFAAMDIPNPRPNYFFIFYSEGVDTYWVVPSLELAKMAFQNKTGKNKGRYTINFCHRQAGRALPDPKYDRYRNAFHLLDC